MNGWRKSNKPRSIGTTCSRQVAGFSGGVFALVWAAFLAPQAFAADTQPLSTNPTPYIQRAEVREFIRDVAQRNDLNQHTIAGWFRDLKPLPHILKAISTPAERTLTWREYRPIFLGAERISAGQTFLRTHQDTLQRAEAEYGVPAEVIAAIIGVETFYGKHKGKHNALESLATLAFDYPPRSKFFTQELEAFIILASEEGWDANERVGSYAAAMGFPQFISSSYRAYAVDFDGDNRRDLINSIDDAIGSVGNYLARHGWKPGEPIAQRWKTTTDNATAVAKLDHDSLKPKVSVDTVRKLGFPASGNDAVSVMQLNGKDRKETWVGYKNFYVITRYNHSRLYAMAVMQLAQQLRVDG